MPGKFSLYQDLTIAENLTFSPLSLELRSKKTTMPLRNLRQIEPFKDRRAGALSGGMKQKLALCCALIHKPKVLFLDEPTGVDPVSRKEFWDMLKDCNKRDYDIGTTPYMDEAALCDRIALIQKAILKIDTRLQISFQNY
jgi:ABC-type multidrug transport system ATPase subunit